ncbi:MAG: DUF2254 domain-containing protein [Ilumatobacteraceae bacterium]
MTSSGRGQRRAGGGRLRRLVQRLRDAYWPIPAACALLAGLGALGLIRVDEGLQRGGFDLAFTGGPDSSRSLLSTIAASMLTLAALVFSITIVVLQLASSQFSPRALDTFLNDRLSQVTLGTFLATFVFALVTLRDIRGQDGLVGRFIPGITISVAFGLAVVSVGMFVVYIHHIAQSIRLVNIVHRIAAETRETIERVHPTDADGQHGGSADGHLPLPSEVMNDGRVLLAPRPGVVASVDTGRIVELAHQADAIVVVLPTVGEFVVAGAPLMRVSGIDEADDDLLGTVELGRERSARQDVGYGFRQLVDIAERALSPGVNDPSTAVTCLDQIHDLLNRLVDRPAPSSLHRDEDGWLRAVVPVQHWDEHVALAIDEIRHWGAESEQVRRRLQAMVDDLLAVADRDRRRPLLDRLPVWPSERAGSSAAAPPQASST